MHVRMHVHLHMTRRADRRRVQTFMSFNQRRTSILSHLRSLSGCFYECFFGWLFGWLFGWQFGWSNWTGWLDWCDGARAPRQTDVNAVSEDLHMYTCR